MSIKYSSILTRAWNITWKFKVLWFFGFLAALGGAGWENSSGGGGAPTFNTGFNSGSSGYRGGDIPRELQPAYDRLAQIDWTTWIGIGVAVICFLLLLGVALWLLSIVGRGGLIGGIVAADTEGKITFRGAWKIGTRNFLRLFLIRLLGIAVFLVMGIVVFLPLLFIGILTCGIGFLPMICVSFVIGVAVRIWFAFMDYAVVVEKCGVGEAIGRAWTVLRDHAGPVIIFWLILFAVSLGVGLGLLILFAPSAVTIFLSVLPLVTGAGSLNTALLVVGIILLVLFIAVSWIVQSVVTVWETAVMVLAYRELIKGSPLLAVSAAA
jgi:hypothetical protein